MSGKRQKMDPTTQDAQEETEMIIFDVVGNLLKTTNTSPAEVPLPCFLLPLGERHALKDIHCCCGSAHLSLTKTKASSPPASAVSC